MGVYLGVAISSLEQREFLAMFSGERNEGECDDARIGESVNCSIPTAQVPIILRSIMIVKLTNVIIMTMTANDNIGLSSTRIKRSVSIVWYWPRLDECSERSDFDVLIPRCTSTSSIENHQESRK